MAWRHALRRSTFFDARPVRYADRARLSGICASAVMASNCVALSPVACRSAGIGVLRLEGAERLNGGDAHARFLVLQQRQKQRSRRGIAQLRQGVCGGFAHGWLDTLEAGGARGFRLRRLQCAAMLPERGFAQRRVRSLRPPWSRLASAAGVLLFSSPVIASRRSALGVLAVLQDASEEIRRLRSAADRRWHAQDRRERRRPSRRRIA